MIQSRVIGGRPITRRPYPAIGRRHQLIVIVRKHHTTHPDWTASEHVDALRRVQPDFTGFYGQDPVAVVAKWLRTLRAENLIYTPMPGDVVDNNREPIVTDFETATHTPMWTPIWVPGHRDKSDVDAVNGGMGRIKLRCARHDGAVVLDKIAPSVPSTIRLYGSNTVIGHLTFVPSTEECETDRYVITCEQISETYVSEAEALVAVARGFLPLS